MCCKTMEIIQNKTEIIKSNKRLVGFALSLILFVQNLSLRRFQVISFSRCNSLEKKFCETREIMLRNKASETFMSLASYDSA